MDFRYETEDLIKFLIKAKKQTYANENAEKVVSSRKCSRDYEYCDNSMIYHDTYFGGTNFIGEEVVYFNNIPIWGMNYYGITLNKDLSEEAVDKVLRPALMLVGTDDNLPVRGPKEFVNGEYKYTFDISGNIEYFQGTETIYFNNEKIYILKCNGGMIK